MKRIKIIDINNKTMFHGWLSDLPLDENALLQYTKKVYRMGDICEKRRSAAKSAIITMLDGGIKCSMTIQQLPAELAVYIRQRERIKAITVYSEE